MATATLTYNLDDADDAMAHLRAVKSLDMALVLWEMAYNTKKGLCYQIEFQEIKDPYDVVDKFMEKLHEEMNDRGINLDDLVV